jgi:WD40 repeat protein
MRHAFALLVGSTLLTFPNIAHSRAPMPTFYTSVAACSLSPDGKLAVICFTSSGSVGGRGYSASVLDAETGKELRSLNLGNSFTGSIPFLPDSRRLLVPTETSVSLQPAPDGEKAEGQTLRIWDAEKGAEVRVFERPRDKDSYVYCIALSPDGKRALAFCRGDKLRLWDVESGKLLRTIDAGDSANIDCMAISPDGKEALTGCPAYVAGCKMTLWDLEEGKVIRSSPPSRVAKNTAKSTWGCEFAFSPSGKWAATDRTIDYDRPKSTQYTLTLWDASTAKVFKELPCQAISPIFTPDGKQLRCGCYGDDNVRLKTWDLESGEVVSSGVIHKMPGGRALSKAFCMAFSADATRLLTATGGSVSGNGSSDDLVIKLWDAATGKEIRTLRQPSKPAASESEGRSVIPSPRREEGRSWRFWRNW